MNGKKRKKLKSCHYRDSLLVIAIAVNYTLAEQHKGNNGAETTPMSGYWTEESEPAQALRDYVAKVTDPSDEENFIPEKDRIAVFDMDGTLVCETYYTYYDTMMFSRILSA